MVMSLWSCPLQGCCLALWTPALRRTLMGYNMTSRGRARGKKHSLRHPQLLSVLPRADSACSRLGHHMETSLHPPSLPWWRFLTPHLSLNLLLPSLPVASCQSTLFFSFPSPVASCNNAFISLLGIKSVSSIVCKF